MYVFCWTHLRNRSNVGNGVEVCDHGANVCGHCVQVCDHQINLMLSIVGHVILVVPSLQYAQAVVTEGLLSLVCQLPATFVAVTRYCVAVTQSNGVWQLHSRSCGCTTMLCVRLCHNDGFQSMVCSDYFLDWVKLIQVEKSQWYLRSDVTVARILAILQCSGWNTRHNLYRFDKLGGYPLASDGMQTPVLPPLLPTLAGKYLVEIKYSIVGATSDLIMTEN